MNYIKFLGYDFDGNDRVLNTHIKKTGYRLEAYDDLR